MIAGMSMNSRISKASSAVKLGRDVLAILRWTQNVACFVGSYRYELFNSDRGYTP